LYEREPPLAISPQLIIGVNELELVQQLQRQYQVAAAVWFTDNHNLIYNDPQGFCLDAASCANVYLFCFSPQQLQWFQLAGAAHARYLALAADPELFYPGAGTAALAAPLSFMGELRYQLDDNRMLKLLAPLIARAHDAQNQFSATIKQFLRFLNDVFNELGSQIDRYGPHYHVEQIRLRCPEAYHCFLDLFPPVAWAQAVENQMNAQQRIAISRVLEPVGLRIWGGARDWDAAGKWRDHARRRCDYWREWPAIVGHSRACLNIFRPTIWQGVPLKAFEIACGGSLLVSNQHPNLAAMFEPGKQCLTFNSLDQCRRLAKAIHDCPQQFADIADAGRARVLAEHTYVHRAHSMLQYLDEAGMLPAGKRGQCSLSIDL